MNKSLVSVIIYEKPLDSVRKAVDLANGFENLPLNQELKLDTFNFFKYKLLLKLFFDKRLSLRII